jgi:hypothetical protein
VFLPVEDGENLYWYRARLRDGMEMLDQGSVGGARLVNDDYITVSTVAAHGSAERSGPDCRADQADSSY